ncbi:MAG: formylglycine-generating enzyme family protein, partial [Moorea sp. SIO4A3]|nr:formylglycine-generating enzyme family protein [Moorena sp. SIO4A3]
DQEGGQLFGNEQPELVMPSTLSETLIPQSEEESLKQFSFEVVTVNRKGTIIKRESQQARYFTEYLGNGVNLEMVYIPAGSFVMGSPESEKGSDGNERPQHQVRVQAFFLGKYQVTQAQWRAVANLPIKTNWKLKPNPSYFKGNNRPVELVSWSDAKQFCRHLSEYTGTEYRLPSEAEWEYACRAGTTTPFHYGETITSKLANYNSNTYAEEAKGKYRGETTAVGSFPPNRFGLYDMHGNVWEYCEDNCHKNYFGAPTDGSIWSNYYSNDGHYELVRGGSWYDSSSSCRSASRSDYDLSCFPSISVGFRVVRVVGRTSP